MRRISLARGARGALGALGVLALAAGGACAGAGSPTQAGPDTARVPLTDLAAHRYLGFQGGLYPDGSNTPPADHAARGRLAAAQLVPLGPDGRPSASGRIVLLSVGMSNTTMEFCNGAFPRCNTASFVGQASADPAVNHATLVPVDGARGGQAAAAWTSPALPQYDSVAARLASVGLTEAQVQVAWVKQADIQPRVSLPAAGADAYVLEKALGQIVRALRARYPNLKQVFLSSRIYAGYAATALNPEPYAYEGGFAVKWLVAAQIRQGVSATPADTLAGDVGYGSVPWLAWGPYLWADGLRPRSDGLTWSAQEFAADGTHPNASADLKVGRMLLEFFKGSELTRCWFLAGQRCS